MKISTQMLHAFLNTRVQPSSPAALVNSVAKAAAASAGVKDVHGWNAHLSRRTYENLKRDCVIA